MMLQSWGLLGSQTPHPSPPAAMTGLMWMPSAPPTFARLIAVHLQPVPVLPAIALVLLGAYLLGVLVLHRRGDAWPRARTAWWVAGVVTVLLLTATGIDGYGMELFSVHMAQHMVIGMFSPILLSLGAPVTLLLRALPARPVGRLHLRAVVLAMVHSRLAAVVTHPVVVVGIFLLSLYGLYFTPIFDALMSTMWGHNLMLLHFLAVGMLYFWGVIGVDPAPRPATRGLGTVGRPVLRVMELGVTVPFHAFFGVILMTAATLITKYYATPVAGWGIDPLADQRVAGGIAWGFTEAPTLLVLGVLLLQWQRSEGRSNAVADRRVARAGADVDLDAYNDYLASLAGRTR